MVDASYVISALERTTAKTTQPAINPVSVRMAAGLPCQDVLGFQLVDIEQMHAIDWLVERAQSGVRTRIGFINAHCVNVARADWRYKLALKTCDALLPDGSGVSLAAKLDGKSLTANLNGTDLFFPLCEAARNADLSVFLLGGQDGVAKAAAEQAQHHVPGLKIAGTQSGYFAPNAETAIMDQINASGADIVMVAFGVPEQDVWLARVAPRLNAPLIMGVGGLLDFVSGRIPRAPKLWRRLGMEWAFRLKTEPGRLWRRYLLGNLGFLAHAVTHSLRARLPKFANTFSHGLKRGLDLAASLGGLIALSPLLLLTALAVRLTSSGPALFRQTRVGENGVRFEMLKFRSMYRDAEARRASLLSQSDRSGPTFKMKNDPRVTPIGGIIRRYSIDELPQLINVLKGDMSLVGPRPALPEEVARYSAHDLGRLAGKPGLTGLWQVSGRARIGFKDMVELDRDYLKRRSFWLDVSILLRTPKAVFGADGAY